MYIFNDLKKAILNHLGITYSLDKSVFLIFLVL